MKQKGFTLIELMVAISIMAVLGTMGIAGFINYNQAQVLQTSANEVVTMLNLAKSRAQSQIKPSSMCLGGNLTGYNVVISAPREYILYLRCSIGPDSKIAEEDKFLPANLNFETSSSFFFPVQTGGVQVSRQISITNKSSRKIINVNSLGGVSVQ